MKDPDPFYFDRELDIDEEKIQDLEKVEQIYQFTSEIGNQMSQCKDEHLGSKIEFFGTFLYQLYKDKTRKMYTFTNTEIEKLCIKLLNKKLKYLKNG